MRNKGIIFLLNCMVIFVLSCDDNQIEPFGSYTWQKPIYDESGATKSLNVAAVSFDVDTSPEVNRLKMVTFIDKIKAEQPDVRLILFPETTLGYYYRPSNPSEYQKSIAETILGVTTSAISQKAVEHQLYISFGMAEKSGEDIYNSQVLIGPNGTILSVHHKNYLTAWDKESGFIAGNDIAVDIIDNIKIATIICHDYHSLDVNKKIHKSGAELVLASFATVVSPINDFYLNQFVYTWILGANRIGKEDGADYDGKLFMITPSGERRIWTSEKEGYIYGVIKCR